MHTDGCDSSADNSPQKEQQLPEQLQNNEELEAFAINNSHSNGNGNSYSMNDSYNGIKGDDNDNSNTYNDSLREIDGSNSGEQRTMKLPSMDTGDLQIASGGYLPVSNSYSNKVSNNNNSNDTGKNNDKSSERSIDKVNKSENLTNLNNNSYDSNDNRENRENRERDGNIYSGNNSYGNLNDGSLMSGESLNPTISRSHHSDNSGKNTPSFTPSNYSPRGSRSINGEEAVDSPRSYGRLELFGGEGSQYLEEHSQVDYTRVGRSGIADSSYIPQTIDTNHPITTVDNTISAVVSHEQVETKSDGENAYGNIGFEDDNYDEQDLDAIMGKEIDTTSLMLDSPRHTHSSATSHLREDDRLEEASVDGPAPQLSQIDDEYMSSFNLIELSPTHREAQESSAKNVPENQEVKQCTASAGIVLGVAQHYHESDVDSRVKHDVDSRVKHDVDSRVKHDGDSSVEVDAPLQLQINSEASNIVETLSTENVANPMHLGSERRSSSSSVEKVEQRILNNDNGSHENVSIDKSAHDSAVHDEAAVQENDKGEVSVIEVDRLKTDKNILETHINESRVTLGSSIIPTSSPTKGCSPVPADEDFAEHASHDASVVSYVDDFASASHSKVTTAVNTPKAKSSIHSPAYSNTNYDDYDENELEAETETAAETERGAKAIAIESDLEANEKRVMLKQSDLIVNKEDGAKKETESKSRIDTDENCVATDYQPLGVSPEVGIKQGDEEYSIKKGIDLPAEDSADMYTNDFASVSHSKVTTAVNTPKARCSNIDSPGYDYAEDEGDRVTEIGVTTHDKQKKVDDMNTLRIDKGEASFCVATDELPIDVPSSPARNLENDVVAKIETDLSAEASEIYGDDFASASHSRATTAVNTPKVKKSETYFEDVGGEAYTVIKDGNKSDCVGGPLPGVTNPIVVDNKTSAAKSDSSEERKANDSNDTNGLLEDKSSDDLMDPSADMDQQDWIDLRLQSASIDPINLSIGEASVGDAPIILLSKSAKSRALSMEGIDVAVNSQEQLLSASSKHKKTATEIMNAIIAGARSNAATTISRSFSHSSTPKAAATGFTVNLAHRPEPTIELGTDSDASVFEDDRGRGIDVTVYKHNDGDVSSAVSKQEIPTTANIIEHPGRNVSGNNVTKQFEHLSQEETSKNGVVNREIGVAVVESFNVKEGFDSPIRSGDQQSFKATVIKEISSSLAVNDDKLSKAIKSSISSNGQKCLSFEAPKKSLFQGNLPLQLQLLQCQLADFALLEGPALQLFVKQEQLLIQGSISDLQKFFDKNFNCFFFRNIDSVDVINLMADVYYQQVDSSAFPTIRAKPGSAINTTKDTDATAALADKNVFIHKTRTITDRTKESLASMLNKIVLNYKRQLKVVEKNTANLSQNLQMQINSLFTPDMDMEELMTFIQDNRFTSGLVGSQKGDRIGVKNGKKAPGRNKHSSEKADNSDSDGNTQPLSDSGRGGAVVPCVSPKRKKRDERIRRKNNSKSPRRKFEIERNRSFRQLEQSVDDSDRSVSRMTAKLAAMKKRLERKQLEFEMGKVQLLQSYEFLKTTDEMMKVHVSNQLKKLNRIARQLNHHTEMIRKSSSRYLQSLDQEDCDSKEQLEQQDNSLGRAADKGDYLNSLNRLTTGDDDSDATTNGRKGTEAKDEDIFGQDLYGSDENDEEFVRVARGDRHNDRQLDRQNSSKRSRSRSSGKSPKTHRQDEAGGRKIKRLNSSTGENQWIRFNEYNQYQFKDQESPQAKNAIVSVLFPLDQTYTNAHNRILTERKRANSTDSTGSKAMKTPSKGNNGTNSPSDSPFSITNFFKNGLRNVTNSPVIANDDDHGKSKTRSIRSSIRRSFAGFTSLKKRSKVYVATQNSNNGFAYNGNQVANGIYNTHSKKKKGGNTLLSSNLGSSNDTDSGDSRMRGYRRHTINSEEYSSKDKVSTARSDDYFAGPGNFVRQSSASAFNDTLEMSNKIQLKKTSSPNLSAKQHNSGKNMRVDYNSDDFGQPQLKPHGVGAGFAAGLFDDQNDVSILDVLVEDSVSNRNTRRSFQSSSKQLFSVGKGISQSKLLKRNNANLEEWEKEVSSPICVEAAKEYFERTVPQREIAIGSTVGSILGTVMSNNTPNKNNPPRSPRTAQLVGSDIDNSRCSIVGEETQRQNFLRQVRSICGEYDCDLQQVVSKVSDEAVRAYMNLLREEEGDDTDLDPSRGLILSAGSDDNAKAEMSRQLSAVIKVNNGLETKNSPSLSFVIPNSYQMMLARLADASATSQVPAGASIKTPNPSNRPAAQLSNGTPTTSSALFSTISRKLSHGTVMSVDESNKWPSPGIGSEHNNNRCTNLTGNPNRVESVDSVSNVVMNDIRELPTPETDCLDQITAISSSLTKIIDRYFIAQHREKVFQVFAKQMAQLELIEYQVHKALNDEKLKLEGVLALPSNEPFVSLEDREKDDKLSHNYYRGTLTMLSHLPRLTLPFSKDRKKKPKSITTKSLKLDSKIETALSTLKQIQKAYVEARFRFYDVQLASFIHLLYFVSKDSRRTYLAKLEMNGTKSNAHKVNCAKSNSVGDAIDKNMSYSAERPLLQLLEVTPDDFNQSSKTNDTVDVDSKNFQEIEKNASGFIDHLQRDLRIKHNLYSAEEFQYFKLKENLRLLQSRIDKLNADAEENIYRARQINSSLIDM